MNYLEFTRSRGSRRAGPRTHKGRPTSLNQSLKEEVTGKVTTSANDTPPYKVGSLTDSSQTQRTPAQIPAGHAEKGQAYPGGTRGAPSRAAHPALAEQVQTAALGLDIEGGAHRGPAGADLPGPDPGSEAAQARSPRP